MHFEAKEVTLFRDKAPPIRAPVEILVQRTTRQCQGRSLFNFSRVSFNQKTLMLHKQGIWHHQEAVKIESITQKKPMRFEDEQLRLWFVVLASTFPKHTAEYFDPQFFTRRLFKDTEDVELQLKLREALKNALRAQSTAKLFIPIHCPESPKHPLGHWTFLVIEKHALQLNQHVVRYYETLDEINEVAVSRANHILECVGLEKLQRTNHMRLVGRYKLKLLIESSF